MSTAAATKRQRHATWQKQQRANERDLQIPPPVDPLRRKEALSDVYKFCEIYHADTFYQGWTDNRRVMVDSIFRSLKYKTAEAIAAPRGEGKSTIAKIVAQYCLIRGLVRFVLIVCSTHEYAQQRLKDVKRLFGRPRSLEFREDFPELYLPCSDVESSSLRARGQTVHGEETNVEWLTNQITLPTVRLKWCPDCYAIDAVEVKGEMVCQSCGSTFQEQRAPFSGGVVTARGITGSIRGQNVNDARPDLVIIDDPDDEESADSETKTKKAVRKINQSIRGLAGPGESLARVMLCTIINRSCAAFVFTDRKLNPAWNGKRFKLIEKMPERMDLWERFIDQVRLDWEQNDEFNRTAHQFYLDNKEEMDRGAVCSNPFRYDSTPTPDGTERESSSLEHAFCIIADVGMESFKTEYQNDPPSLDGDQTDHLTPGIVTGSNANYARRLTGESRGVIPEQCEDLTAFIDVQSHWLWYSVVAWLPHGQSMVVDYGEFGRNISTKQFGQQEAIRQRLQLLHDQWDANPYLKGTGAIVDFSKVLVDSGFEAEAVYDSVLSFGDQWRATKGDGKYKHPKRSKEKRPSRSGERWYESPIQYGSHLVKLVLFDANWWKHRCQDAWLIKPESHVEGSVFLFGDYPSDHREFGRQMSAARFVVEHDEKHGERTHWAEQKDNHYWDCYVGNLVGRSLSVDARSRRRGRKLTDIARSKRGTTTR